MDFTLNPAQTDLRIKARAFAKRRLRDVASLIASEPTPEGRFRATRPVYEELVAEGFLARMVPIPFGGGGTGALDMAVVAEEFHAVDVNVSLTMFANLLGLMPVFIAGSETQRATWIAPFLACKGAPLAGLANSEPGGSANFDAALPSEGTRTTARLESGQWVINGRKQWISSATGWDGAGADFLAVVCRTSASGGPNGLSVIGLTKPMSGFRDDGAIDTIGHRGHLVPRFTLDNVRAPEQNLIGTAGDGASIVSRSFSATAALVGVMAVGSMRAAFEATLEFTKTQHRGGPHRVIDYQAVGYALADAKGELEAARSLAWRACWAADAQHPGAAELALHAKVWCSEAVVRVITSLIRAMGIEAYDRTMPLAGILEDAIAYSIFDGGNMGVRRKQLHHLLASPEYDPQSASA